MCDSVLLANQDQSPRDSIKGACDPAHAIKWTSYPKALEPEPSHQAGCSSLTSDILLMTVSAHCLILFFVSGMSVLQNFGARRAEGLRIEINLVSRLHFTTYYLDN